MDVTGPQGLREGSRECDRAEPVVEQHFLTPLPLTQVHNPPADTSE
jgi:hypothetical protein